MTEPGGTRGGCFHLDVRSCDAAQRRGPHYWPSSLEAWIQSLGGIMVPSTVIWLGLPH